MGDHPLNLGLRLVLELIAWGAAGFWGWTYFSGVLGVGAAIHYLLHPLPFGEFLRFLMTQAGQERLLFLYVESFDY